MIIQMKKLFVLLAVMLPLAAMAQEAVQESDFALSWPLGKGNNDATAAAVAKDGLFSIAEFDHGALNVSQTRAAGASQQTLYKPSQNNAQQPNDDDVLTFTIKQKKGLTFAPKSFAFESSKWGTGGGAFDVVAIANGTEKILATGVNPARNNEFSSYNYDLSNITVGDDGLVLKIKVYKLADNKEYGFGSVVVTGDVAGTIEAVPTYTMTVKLGTEGAGQVSCSPAGAEFDEGTELTVTATENFGSHFQAWVDENGETVSTANPYTFTISKNTTLIATYEQVAVYALNVAIDGDANAYMIKYQPEGNVVGGVHHYEAGTDVKLTATNNKILTFTQWEDGATNAERTITMDADKSVKATYSAVDYIVGWDFVNLDPKQARKGDFIANSENAGNFSLEKTDGTTRGWLAHADYDGKSCAINWSGLNDGYNFNAQFKTTEYSNLRVAATLECHYNAHKNIIWQYSVDGGTTWNDFGQTTLQSAAWQEQQFALPAEANNQATVKVRWYEDLTSEVIGNSGNNGVAITDVFVMGDLTMVDDGKAPVLVSSNPEQNATGVSANGSIILNFDEKIVAAEGVGLTPTLSKGDDAEALPMNVSGKAAVFAYAGLKYNTQYTFTIPAGLIADRTGNAYEGLSLTFTTMERQQPAARLYDAVVAQDGTGDYSTLQAAIDAAPAGRGTPWLIFVKNGRYNEHIDIPAAKTCLHIIGQDRDKTVVYDNRLSGGDNAYPVDPGATVVVKAKDTFFENITLENSYGYEQLAGPQALALNTQADRVAMNNVALLSYQDTWITASNQTYRHYIKNSLIEGAVDFIYNGGDVYLDGDTIQINRPSGGYIVAPNHTAETRWGYVFQNNIIRPRSDINVTDVWLGRPWHNQPKTVFINTQTFVDLPAKGWYNTMGGLPALWAEYNTVDRNGNPVDLSQRETYYYYTDRETGLTHEVFDVQNTLTAEEAAQYTLRNVLGGNDNWQPDLLCEPIDTPTVIINGSQIEWASVPYAICYVITKDGQVVGFTTDTSYPYASDATWQVQAVNENGGLSRKATAVSSIGINQLDAQNSELIIQNSDAVCNIAGQRVSAGYKGLVVKQGRKTIVK